MAKNVLHTIRERGFLDGQFLIAMPGMFDTNFARTVIFVCAHSEDGAMGFILNRPQRLTFPDVLLHLRFSTRMRRSACRRLRASSRSRPGAPLRPGAASYCIRTIT